MQTPSRLEEWSLEVIKSLVKLGTSEHRDFEFKSGRVLRDGEGIGALSKQVSAFANSRGGFIVIGVSEGSPRTIEGVEVDGELAKRINDRIKVYPMPSYPAPLVIPFKKGLSIVVVEVPASQEGPYASIADKIPQFYVRTHSGAEPMNWVAIRDGMIRADERRRQVEVLLGEFEQHFMTYRAHMIAAREQIDFPDTHTFELTLTRQALAAVYPWLSKDPHAGPEVARLMSRMNFINGHVQAMIADVAARPQRLKDWRGRMVVVLVGFRDHLAQADAGIRRVFGLPVADYRKLYPEY
jgi:predicted HTH transcriptional regulator